jgi:hypothetical protein
MKDASSLGRHRGGTTLRSFDMRNLFQEGTKLYTQERPVVVVVVLINDLLATLMVMRSR